MTPSAPDRTRGKTTYVVVQTDFGPTGIGLTNNLVTRVWLPGLGEQKLADEIARWSPAAQKRRYDRLSHAITKYFAGDRTAFDFVCDTSHLTDFARKVVATLCQVGWGETITYGELARRAGRKNAARAVGSVMAHNRTPLIVPCHRVLPASGRLGNFSGPGGVAQKQKMLELEKSF